MPLVVWPDLWHNGGMSITFYLTTTTGDLACAVSHGAGCTSAEHLASDAWSDLPGHDMCYDCREEQIDACPVCSLSLNVSNVNGAQILASLGVESDYCGSIDPADLLGRSLLGPVTTDDSGIAPTVDGGPGTGRAMLVECGLPAGYFAERFGRLADLASSAMAHGLVVAWS